MNQLKIKIIIILWHPKILAVAQVFFIKILTVKLLIAKIFIIIINKE